MARSTSTTGISSAASKAARFIEAVPVGARMRPSMRCERSIRKGASSRSVISFELHRMTEKPRAAAASSIASNSRKKTDW